MNKLSLQSLSLILLLCSAGFATASKSPVPKAETEMDTARGELQRAREALQQAAEKVARLYSGNYAPRALRLFGLGDGHRAMLGVSISDEDNRGLRIEAVTPGGPAAEAGLKNGDIITAIDDIDLVGDRQHHASRKLIEYLSKLDPGDNVVVHYLRQGKSGELKVVTEALGDDINVFAYSNAPGGFSVQPGHGSTAWAFQLHNGPFDDLELVKLSKGLGSYFGTSSGLLVVHVPRDNQLSLQDGDVLLRIGNRRPKNQRQAMRILNSYDPDEVMEVQVMRHQKHKTLRSTPRERPAKNDTPRAST